MAFQRIFARMASEEHKRRQIVEIWSYEEWGVQVPVVLIHLICQFTRGDPTFDVIPIFLDCCQMSEPMTLDPSRKTAMSCQGFNSSFPFMRYHGLSDIHVCAVGVSPVMTTNFAINIDVSRTPEWNIILYSVVPPPNEHSDSDKPHISSDSRKKKTKKRSKLASIEKSKKSEMKYDDFKEYWSQVLQATEDHTHDIRLHKFELHWSGRFSINSKRIPRMESMDTKGIRVVSIALDFAKQRVYMCPKYHFARGSKSSKIGEVRTVSWKQLGLGAIKMVIHFKNQVSIED